MKDKRGKPIEIGDTVLTIDYIGPGVVIEIHEEEDKITTRREDGSIVKSSKGVSHCVISLGK